MNRSFQSKEYTIETAKFIGRYHGHLTKIMDLLNMCHAFQVLAGLFLKVFRTYIILSHPIYDIHR